MSNLTINRLNTADTDFSQALHQLIAWEMVSNADVEAKVAEILQQVRASGDKALIEYSNQFDRRNCQSMEQIALPRERLQESLEAIEPSARAALQTAAERIRHYHGHQLQESWQYQEANGTVLGQQVTPLDRVGIYVPGGKASYPSSVLMNCIPARVAGVNEVIMTVPAPDDQLNPCLLYTSPSPRDVEESRMPSSA